MKPEKKILTAGPTISQREIDYVLDAVQNGWNENWSGYLTRFERGFADYVGTRFALATSSCTGALHLSLMALGVGPGDEVIVPEVTWIATASAVKYTGATPVFVDIDPATRNMDLDLLEKAITPRTKALMPVYLSGLPVDMDRLYAIARAHKLRVIEDAAQAFGSSWNGERIGKLGDIVSFSFHANKNLTSIEGGALVLNNEEEAVLAQKYRLQGITRTGFDGMDCDVLGGKYNLTDVAARVGLGQLPHLERFLAQRKKLVRAYFAGLEGGAAVKLGIGLPFADFENSNWHMFQITLPLEKLSIDRAGFMGQLKERGIGSGVHYPAIHLFSLYRARGFKEGMFPHAERFGRTNVTLPLFTLMNEGDVERVCRAVNEICEQYGK
jgi:dTDP-4-amino-4,6-dideoxygalactose transaminase